MKKEYLIEKLKTGKTIVIYFINDVEDTREHYAGKDGVIVTELKQGYVKHKDSL